MELKELGKYAVVLLIVGVICIMGMAITDRFSYTVRDTTTTTLDGLTLGAVNVSTSIGASYPYVQQLTGCYNESNASLTLSTSYYAIAEGGRTGGYITLNDAGAVWATETVNCSNFVYLADSTAQASADLFTSGIAVFGTFIGILVLALVGKFVINMFKGDKEE